MKGQQILDAMNGIALVLDGDLVITHFGEKNWRRFWRENGGAGEPGLVGDRITDHISEGEVRDLYRELFIDVATGRVPSVHIDYRCDAPSRRRAMRLSVTPIGDAPSDVRLLYQSILLAEDLRPPLPLFAAAAGPAGAPGTLSICSICKKVRWPGETGDREWIEASEYYRRGGPEVILLSHGFCASCHAALRKMRG